MPSLTRWFIKVGLPYFVAALAVGIAMTVPAVSRLSPAVAALRPVYLHLLVVGWLTQLIFGVAYWMFPAYSKERPRGFEGLAWATFLLLNAGLILRVIGEPMQAMRSGAIWSWMLAASALLQWLAGLGFVVNIWGRVKER